MEFSSITGLYSFVLILCVKMCNFSIALIAFEIAAVRLRVVRIGVNFFPEIRAEDFAEKVVCCLGDCIEDFAAEWCIVAMLASYFVRTCAE